MKINLIIDGNFILYKNVFLLKRVNEIYGKLETAMNNSVRTYNSMFMFDNVYFVSDSKGGSWRKKYFPEYKGNRTKDDSIDWEHVNEIYETFKQNIPKRYKLLESKYVEGDDWVSYLVNKYKDESFIIISNDHDLKQLLQYDITNERIVLMSNEMYKNGKLFLPKGYKTFLTHIAKNTEIDLFDMNNDLKFVNYIKNYAEIIDTEEVYADRFLIEKVIQGDKGDNVPSSIIINGRGIGVKGAEKIYDKYISEFNKIPDMKDSDFLDNLADLICEYKKLSYSSMDEVKGNLKRNIKLMSLETNDIPQKINERMENIHCPKSIM